MLHEDEVCLTDEVVADTVCHKVALLLRDVLIEPDEELIFGYIVDKLVVSSVRFERVVEIFIAIKHFLHELLVLVNRHNALEFGQYEIEPAEVLETRHFSDKTTSYGSELDIVIYFVAKFISVAS